MKEGGQIRHVFFATGQGQLLAFMEPRGVPGVPVEFDGGLNRPLGMPEGVYHFAFEAGSQAELEAKRAELIRKGVKVTPVVDHEWAKSIYFKDPNALTRRPRPLVLKSRTETADTPRGRPCPRGRRRAYEADDRGGRHSAAAHHVGQR